MSPATGWRSSTITAGTATYTEGPPLNSTTSPPPPASELVTELLQYIADPTDLTRAEAEAPAGSKHRAGYQVTSPCAPAAAT